MMDETALEALAGKAKSSVSKDFQTMRLRQKLDPASTSKSIDNAVGSRLEGR